MTIKMGHKFILRTKIAELRQFEAHKVESSDKEDGFYLLFKPANGFLNQAPQASAPGFLISLSFRQSMCVCVHSLGHK